MIKLTQKKKNAFFMCACESCCTLQPAARWPASPRSGSGRDERTGDPEILILESILVSARQCPTKERFTLMAEEDLTRGQSCSMPGGGR